MKRGREMTIDVRLRSLWAAAEHDQGADCGKTDRG